MCWFITIGVSSAAIPVLQNHQRRRGELAIRECVNPHVVALLSPSDACFEVTHGGCSCDLYAESLHVAPHVHERARRQYEQKGWSQTKIARALEASRAAESTRAARDATSGPKRAFRELIADLARTSGTVRLLAHMYSGLVDEEVVGPGGRCRITWKQFVENGFPPDVVVEIDARLADNADGKPSE
jgi:hypothetical protein